MPLKRKWLIATIVLISPLVSGAHTWRFRTQLESSGNHIYLSEDSSTLQGCTGKMAASEQMFALDKFTYIRELCYEVDKSRNVKLTDPKKIIFFNTFSIPVDKFITIPSAKERLEEQQKQENAEFDRRFELQYNETLRLQQQRMQQLQRRQPIFCSHIGNMTFCD